MRNGVWDSWDTILKRVVWGYLPDEMCDQKPEKVTKQGELLESCCNNLGEK